MNIIQDFIPVGRGNRPGLSLSPKFITIHDTANPETGADALMHARYLKGEEAAKRPASWHFSVSDKCIVQHLPLNEVGWHAGDGNGPGNLTSIAIEICENVDGDRMKAEANAAELVASLLKQFGLSVDRVVQHNKWSGKNCPHIIRGRNGWDAFIRSVVNREDEERMVEELLKRIEALEAKASMPVPDWAKEAVDAAVKQGIVKEPDGGSLDFYRILTIIHRKGLI